MYHYRISDQVPLKTKRLILTPMNVKQIDEMLAREPRLAASLSALLARKLSLRLRAVSASLSARENRQPREPRPAH